MRKLKAGNYCELHYFTNRGLDNTKVSMQIAELDALVLLPAGSGIHSWVPAAAIKDSKAASVVQDEYLSWEALNEAAPHIILSMIGLKIIWSLEELNQDILFEPEKDYKTWKLQNPTPPASITGIIQPNYTRASSCTYSTHCTNVSTHLAISHYILQGCPAAIDAHRQRRWDESAGGMTWELKHFKHVEHDPVDEHLGKLFKANSPTGDEYVYLGSGCRDVEQVPREIYVILPIEGELRSAFKSYQQLLECFDAGSLKLHDSTLHDPVDWTNEKKKKKNCGVLKALNVDDNSGLGPRHYLVQQDGSVYCAHDWKACQFATTYFPAWSGKLEEDSGIKTESVKVKSTLDIKTESGSMAWTNSAKSKHPPSLTIFTFGIQPKKKQVDIDNPHLAIQRVASLPSSLMAGKNCAIQSTVESNASPTNLNVTHSVPEVAPTLATIFCLIPPSSREPCIIIEDSHNWTDHPHFC
ncbi:hypothetical protein EDB19DRAFT_1827588 [Suillus lakei]|nr:hypothetical protein EDB19DRAFT_1827588 [Suillus lakei]